jgi:hypothetical protein
MIKKLFLVCLLVLNVILFTGCSKNNQNSFEKFSILGILSLFRIPDPQPYPYRDPALLKADAQKASDDLEAYIKDWYAGTKPALVPESVLPAGIYLNDENNGPDEYLKNFTLYKRPDLTPAQVTNVKNAAPINQAKLYGGFNDPHYTYLITDTLAPFGSSTIIKGKFPKSRFFMITVTPPFNALQYHYMAAGPCEVPIIDADIDPDPGSVNPFRPGANRNATDRNYTVTYNNVIDDQGLALDLYCPKPPYYRSTGNTRYSSLILAQGPGPFGLPAGYNAVFRKGTIWLRYALPDGYGTPGFDPLAGAGIPEIYHKLASGEEFMLIPDIALRKEYLLQTFPALTQNNDMQVYPDYPNGWGWGKMFGIYLSIIIGGAEEFGLSKQWVHDFIRGIEGRGYDLPAPGNWEGSATCVNYCSYLGSGIILAPGKVAVITGKLPTFPETINGEATMPADQMQMRYWSLSTYESPDMTAQGNSNSRSGLCNSSVNDSEIVLDNTTDRGYILCWSRAADKPLNATVDNKVTWVEWGPNSNTHWTMRWVSVSPDWYFEKSPTEQADRLPWTTGSWETPNYDTSLIGQNNRSGWLGEYHPVINWMSKKCFVDMGVPTRAKIDAVAWGSTCQ